MLLVPHKHLSGLFQQAPSRFSGRCSDLQAQPRDPPKSFSSSMVPSQPWSCAWTLLLAAHAAKPGLHLRPRCGSYFLHRSCDPTRPCSGVKKSLSQSCSLGYDGETMKLPQGADTTSSLYLPGIAATLLVARGWARLTHQILHSVLAFN